MPWQYSALRDALKAGYRSGTDWSALFPPLSPLPTDPKDAFPIIDEPCVITDKDGVILVWSLPQVLTPEVHVRAFPSSLPHPPWLNGAILEINLGFMPGAVATGCTQSLAKRDQLAYSARHVHG